ncbi:MAG: hypothetical protein KIS87_08810, partial [Phycisphaeraceae bacterium]|nr:hypothetical protein [Phycisphaeraceae bacterium]
MSRSITLIVGTWRTGSSALAGALHAAGTHLGSQLKEHVRPRLLDHAPTGTFECTRLDALLLAALKFPEGERRIPAAGLELQIGNWLRDHCEEAEEFGRPCAGKHPALAYVLPQLAAAAFARRINVRYIDTSRPPAAIVDSLVAR